MLQNKIFLLVISVIFLARNASALDVNFKNTTGDYIMQEISFSITSVDYMQENDTQFKNLTANLTVRENKLYDVYVFAKLNVSNDLIMEPGVNMRWTALSDDNDVYYYGSDGFLKILSGDCVLFNNKLVISNDLDPSSVHEVNVQIYEINETSVDESPAMASEIYHNYLIE